FDPRQRGVEKVFLPFLVPNRRWVETGRIGHSFNGRSARVVSINCSSRRKQALTGLSPFQLVEDAPARDFQQPTFERIYRWIVSEPGHFSGYGDERLLDHLVGLDLIQTGPARDTVDQLAISPRKLLPTRLVAQVL